MANPDESTNESGQGPLAPKERRRRRRQARAAAPRPPRAGAERQEERREERRRKAAQRRRYRQRLKARRPARAEPAAVAPAASEPGPQPAARRKLRQGIVVSDRADKMITVRIDVARRHRRYEKIVRSSTTLHAHDERNEAHIGDTVSVVESRPRSRTKRWRLLGVLERAR